MQREDGDRHASVTLSRLETKCSTRRTAKAAHRIELPEWRRPRDNTTRQYDKGQGNTQLRGRGPSRDEELRAADAVRQ
jgi:hypothetical protein